MQSVSTRKPQRREELFAALAHEERLVGVMGVMLTQAIADRVGLTATDLKTIDLFNLFGPMSPGRLAGLTGLTTGGVTRLIDRLERAGFVRREPDPHDRRRVIVRPQQPASEACLKPYYGPMSARMAAMLAKYSAEELGMFLDYTAAARRIFQDEVARVRSESAGDEPSPLPA